MEQALFKEKGSDYTEQLRLLDEQQDLGFQCLRYHITANQYDIQDASRREKAKKMETIIRRHGWSLFSFGYQKQLAVSRSLITELKEEEHALIISELGLTEVFEAWCQAVDQFEAMYTRKVESSAAIDEKAASEIGKEAIAFVEKILPGWYYQAEFGGDDNYKTLVNQIMEGAEDIEIQARTRTTRRRNKKEAEMN